MKKLDFSRVGEQMYHNVLENGLNIFVFPKPDFQKVAQVCSDPKYKGRLLFSAGEKPHLALRLKKGDDVLKLAALVLKDFGEAE